MKLSPNNLQKLSDIIERTHIVFIGQQVGTKILSNSDKEILRLHGIDVTLLPLEGKVDLAFKFGLLAEALGKEKAKDMTFSDLKKFVESGDFLPLSEIEEFALDTVKQRSYSDIKGLGNRITKDISTLAVESARKRRLIYEKRVKSIAIESVKKGKTVTQMASDLGHKTKDWARDLDRVADFILHEAFDLGKAHSTLREFGPEARVYKEVYKGACDHCQRLYLTNGVGSKPIIFNITELLANGTNIGRKTKDWKAVCGPLHPWCRCELESIPPGYEWNDESKTFKLTRLNKVERKSRVKITISKS